MNEEQYISEDQARQLLAIDSAINLAKGYCQRCFLEEEREENRRNCLAELDKLAEMDMPAVIEAGEIRYDLPLDAADNSLTHICKNCDFKLPYVAEALEQD
ncbi:hypothetical protein KY338_00635 [Candidatus Woesearchaeota archaeon]|nr:hypothetical protein [Candidatus Woesearchaeota archaeon]MBW3005174.1 hypothetical protein [Candidatus Woesearchaeota archaeon]